ncbi:MAG: hypothetical protein WAX89_01365 [Alphaproteobacteria bacterium]
MRNVKSIKNPEVTEPSKFSKALANGEEMYGEERAKREQIENAYSVLSKELIKSKNLQSLFGMACLSLVAFIVLRK